MADPIIFLSFRWAKMGWGKEYTLQPFSSKWDLWTQNISLSWMLVRRYGFHPTPKNQNLRLTKFPGQTVHMPIMLEEHCSTYSLLNFLLILTSSQFSVPDMESYWHKSIRGRLCRGDYKNIANQHFPSVGNNMWSIEQVRTWIDLGLTPTFLPLISYSLWASNVGNDSTFLIGYDYLINAFKHLEQCPLT